MLPSTEQSAAAYTGVRTRLTELLRGRPDAAGVAVPACPGWTVKDVVAHLAGGCEDILAGRLEGVATDPWTAAQVERFADASLDEILDVWDDAGPQVEAIVPAIPKAPAAQLVFDATTHELDVRGALGDTGGRDSDGIVVGLGFLLGSLDRAARAQGLPTLEVRAEGHTWQVGEGVPATVLETSLFEVVRSFGGRRSLEQITALPWQGAPFPIEQVLTGEGPIRPPDDPLVE